MVRDEGQPLGRPRRAGPPDDRRSDVRRSPYLVARGVAPTRNSSFADPRVKAKAKVGPGTTRHLDVVKWTIDNAMATEPHMPLWAGLSTNEIPTELGKLLTGQDYGGDAKKCMDKVAELVDAKVKDAGL